MAFGRGESVKGEHRFRFRRHKGNVPLALIRVRWTDLNWFTRHGNGVDPSSVPPQNAQHRRAVWSPAAVSPEARPRSSGWHLEEVRGWDGGINAWSTPKHQRPGVASIVIWLNRAEARNKRAAGSTTSLHSSRALTLLSRRRQFL